MKEKKYVCKYNLLFINIISLVLLCLTIGITYFCYKLGWLDFFIDLAKERIMSAEEQNYADFSFFIEIVLLILYLGLHELVHGIAYIVMGAKRENIKYGIALEKGILFTKCGEFVGKKTILVSILSPFIVLGVCTYILSIVLSNSVLLFLSILNIAGCAGDITLFFFFLKRESNFQFCEIGDSSTFLLHTKEDLSTKKFLSVSVEEIEEDIEDKTYTKKINVSKTSKWVIIFIFSIFLLSLVNVILF